MSNESFWLSLDGVVALSREAVGRTGDMSFSTDADIV